jgi:hypothetical protein
MRKINIQISVDEGFDRLSILSVKYQQVTDPKLKEILSGQIIDLETRIAKSIGYKTYQNIIKSVEYSNLYDSNLEVFDGVNLAKSDVNGEKISGHELDKLNNKRTSAKRSLLQKFCGIESEEVKIKGSGELI